MKSVGLEIIMAAEVARCTARVNKVFEGYYCLQYIDGGSIDLRNNEQEMTLKGTWAFASLDKTYSAFKPSVDPGWWHHRYCAFSGSRAKEWMQHQLLPIKPLRVFNRELITAKFDRLISLFASGSSYSASFSNQLEDLLISIKEGATRAREKNANVVSVMHELERDFGSAIDYAQLAKKYGYSESTLRRKFHSELGISLHQYRLQAKLTAAKSLLSDTSLSIGEISDQLGYESIFYFSRQFKKMMKITPSEMRKLI